MKAARKAILFVLLLTLLDFLLRQGFIASIFPLPLAPGFGGLLLYSVFALLALGLSHWFSKSEAKRLHDFGISSSFKNRKDFYLGLGLGIILWGIVALSQSWLSGFSWVLRPEVTSLSIVQGLIFIFIADLGTELYTRCYPLSKLNEGFGARAALWIMTLFVALKTYLFNFNGDFLFYTILIPSLHTLFFSIIYFKTKRLGAALGMHTGANFITISIFDLRPTNPDLTIPSGLFEADRSLEELSIYSLQLPWVLMASLFSLVVYWWWTKSKNEESSALENVK